MKVIFIVLLLSFSSALAADEPIKVDTFTPGNYKLLPNSGSLQDCGDGKFEIRDHNTNLALGPLHAFDLDKKTHQYKGESKEDRNCVYDDVDDVRSANGKTILLFTEKQLCDGKLTSLREERAEVQPEIIRYTFSQKSTGADHKGDILFNCNWKLKE